MRKAATLRRKPARAAIVVCWAWNAARLAIPDESIDEIQARLRRVEGQIRAVQRMELSRLTETFVKLLS